MSGVYQGVVEYFLKYSGVYEAFLSGSRAICVPPPTGTDIDIAVLAQRVYDPRAPWGEWEPCGDYDGNDRDDDFGAFRKGVFNVLVFTNKREFAAMRWCTSLAARLNMQCKEDRYELFSVVRSLANPKEKGILL